MQERLDIFISKSENITRSLATKLIKAGCVFVHEKVECKPSFKISANEPYFIKKQEVKAQDLQKPDFEVEIIFEDEDILVLNKPAGVVVHPAPSVKEPTLIHWLLASGYALSSLGGELRAGLVHRLDKGTSGALIIAKNDFAHANLTSQLQDKSMGRYYLALCDLPLKTPRIITEKSIGRAVNNRLKKQCYAPLPQGNKVENFSKHLVDFIPKDARSAKSEFALLINAKPALIAAKLYTGRTHQIRAHLADLNRHILGDTLYGYKGKCERVCLHAYILYFKHPRSGKDLRFVAPIPTQLKNIMEKYFEKGKLDEKINPSSILRTFT